ncbi:sphingomyelin phosphodiesterase 4 isoform X1 [Euwallacea similis]|uniref:sphingomyelin phosphodiesterase 4 isoform X1 n=2 Tax=Euwallacea similis TaxID=1736056 RepID=UPI00344CA563
MFPKDYDNFMLSVQQVLKLPIRNRCAELTVLLDRASLLELHNFFPVLIDNIFGPQGTDCWGLRATTDGNLDDFRQLHHFLSPCGPLFRLIYTLLKDPNIKYEFSLSYLPVKVRQLLELPSAYAFYSELMNINPQSKQLSSLLLNPFDYYFFHFAYHLINPWQQRVGSTVTSWNTVYYSLSCDYILHFLPTNPVVKILPEIYYNGKNPLKQVSPPSSTKSSPRDVSGLMNTSPFGKIRDEKPSMNLHSHHPRNEIWRSETVLTVLTDIWLYNDLVSQNLSTSDINYSFNTTPMRLHYNELPTGEYIRIVRVLIKQLHAFADSAKCDDTYLCELKKIAIPMIQGKFYMFIRNLIHRWPLDGSFRLVLELWLTYIQPWRYPATNLIKQLVKQDNNPDVDDVALGIEKQQLNPTSSHLPFIAENLLCYVVIFEQLLPRFCRVDLVSPKISVMLYRITKVFDQPSLPNFLREVEQCVDSRQHSPTHKKYSGWSNDLPAMSPNHSWSSTLPSSPIRLAEDFRPFSSPANASLSSNNMAHADKKWSAITRQKIFELEGPNFCYKPLFGNPPAQEIFELLTQIRKSIRQAEELIRVKEQEERELYSGFWGSIKYFLQSPVSTDEFTLDDRRKVPVYLEVSLNNLKDMFSINDDEMSEDQEPVLASNGNGFEMLNDFKFLTPEKVRSRLKTIRYDGDPDLHPIRSDESAFLVRTLYQLALKINENFGQTFYQLYHNPSYKGRFSRQFLLPPMTAYKYDKTVELSPRVNIHLPPRVSFRHLAGYRFLTYFCLGGALAWLLGYRLNTYLFFLMLIYIIYKLIRAIPRDSTSIRHSYPTQGFGNISFNHSF